MVLLHFLRWLRANTDIEFDVLSGDSGDLLPEFQQIARKTQVAQSPGPFARLARRLVGPAFYRRWEDNAFVNRYHGRDYGLVYANTVCRTREMRLLARLGFPVVCHVHELEYSLKFFAGHDAFAEAVPSIRHFIAVSKAVQDYLAKDWAVQESKITLVHEFIPAGPSYSGHAETRETVRRALGVPDDGVLVGGCGTLDWRKGADLFVQTARIVRSAPGTARVRFLWVGGKRGTPDFLRFEHDLRFCGLTEAVTVVETCPNPLDYFCAMDLFALTSREDPFPLVMLEAGSVGLPVVCFESSGGAREFVEKDAGLIAPYLDTAAMADHILTLAREPGLRREMGANAVHKVRARYTVERQAPKLLEVIRRHLKAPG